MSQPNTLEQNRNTLVQEFVTTYGISEKQISFEFNSAEPIFDFDAICLLRERLTNFQAVDVSRVSFNEAEQSAEAICTITQANGRPITISDFAQMGEIMPDGTTIQNSIQAKRVARARAMRSGIRAAGVDLLKAHKNYLENGDFLDFTPIDPRANRVKEIHALAEELGLIVGKDKEAYQEYIGEKFDGRTSTNDLDDLELQKLATDLRALKRLNFARQNDKQLAA
jgi:hypothetical protein